MSPAAATPGKAAHGALALTDFPIQPARPQQGRVQGVRPVGGHDHLDSVQRVEAVHLVQQLEIEFPFSSALSTVSCSTS